jgi:Kef-type K+ transport system membrane component KefB
VTPVAELAVVAAVVAVAGLVSARLRTAAALVELTLGVAAGALLPVDPKASWLALLAAVAGVAVTFVAGSEIDTAALRRAPGPALVLGLAAFLAPFGATVAAAHLALGWSLTASVVAGAVLGETSLAVTYSVLLELRLVRSELGRLLMAAVFVTDVAAAAVMTAVVSTPSWALLGFTAGSAAVCALLPTALAATRRLAGSRPSEPGLRVVVAALAGLLVLAQVGGGVAVLPAFVLGVVAARYFRDDPEEHARLRSVVMGFLAPFVFVRAGMSVSLPAVVAGAAAVPLLVAAKVGPKALASLAVLHRTAPGRSRRARRYGGAVLMSTGLTFGTVINLAALQAGLVDSAQFSVLAATVLVSALVPGAVAQRALARTARADAAASVPAQAGVRTSANVVRRRSVNPIDA